MKEYLTIKNYIDAFFLFIPAFFAVGFLIFALFPNANADFKMLCTFIFSILVIYLRLKVIASTKEKELKMLWESQQKFKKQD